MIKKLYGNLINSLNGLKIVIKENSFILELIGGIFLILYLFITDISTLFKILILSVYFLLLAFEIFNTSIEKLVSTQQDLNTLIKGQFGERSSRDLENLTRLRNIEVQLSRLVDELANARKDALSEIRSDLAQLSKAIIDLARNSSKG